MMRFTAMVAGAAVLVAGLGVSVSMAQLKRAAPDLEPIPSRLISTGTVSVRNKGSADAGPFVVAIRCDKQGGGGCGEYPIPRQFINPAYPGRLVVNVGGLAKGHVFNFKLPFWDAMKAALPPGNYNYVIDADAGAAVAETNEMNNIKGGVLHK